jgi:hypothetical protein
MTPLTSGPPKFDMLWLLLKGMSNFFKIIKTKIVLHFIYNIHTYKKSPLWSAGSMTPLTTKKVD